MDWISRLERKYRHFCIHGLMKILVIGCTAVFAATLFGAAQIVISWLSLDSSMVLKGQIWRLITFIFIPETLNPIFIIFELYLLYIFGTELEKVWGSFRLNVFYAIGMLSAIVAAFISGYGSALYLNLSIFLAFAYIYPDFQLLVFFVIPLKVKYLAFFQLIVIAVSLIFSPAYMKIAAVISFANFIIFFGKEIYYTWLLPRIKAYLSRHRKQKNQKAIQRKFKAIVHKCRECNRTSNEYPNLRFGYCIKCGSDYEYCQDHLGSHTHIN